MSESKTPNYSNNAKLSIGTTATANVPLSEEDLNKMLNLKELRGNVEVTKCAMIARKQNLDLIESSLEEIDILFDSSDNMLKIGNCFFPMEVEDMEKFLTEFEKEDKQKYQKLTTDFQNFTEKKEILTKELVDKFGAEAILQ